MPLNSLHKTAKLTLADLNAGISLRDAVFLHIGVWIAVFGVLDCDKTFETLCH